MKDEDVAAYREGKNHLGSKNRTACSLAKVTARESVCFLRFDLLTLNVWLRNLMDGKIDP